MRPRWLQWMIFPMLFQIQILILFASNIEQAKGWSVKEVIYSCTRGLDGRISDCKLGMHSKCFDEIQRSLIHDVGSGHSSSSNQLKKLKSCCHHSLKDMHVHTDGAWWKMTKYYHQKDIVNYPDGCIIVWSPFLLDICQQWKRQHR